MATARTRRCPAHCPGIARSSLRSGSCPSDQRAPFHQVVILSLPAPVPPESTWHSAVGSDLAEPSRAYGDRVAITASRIVIHGVTGRAQDGQRLAAGADAVDSRGNELPRRSEEGPLHILSGPVTFTGSAAPFTEPAIIAKRLDGDADLGMHITTGSMLGLNQIVLTGIKPFMLSARMIRVRGRHPIMDNLGAQAHICLSLR